MRILLHWSAGEQPLDAVLGEQGTAQNAHHLIDVALQLEVVFNDSHEAVGDDSGINLDSDSILCVSPEGLHPQVLLYPFEKQLDLPSVFIKEGDVGGFQVEVVRVVDEGALQLRGVVDNPADDRRIVSCVMLAIEPDGLVSQHVLLVNHILTLYYLICRLAFLTDDKERVYLLNVEKPCQVPIASVEDIAGQRLIRDFIHCIDIVHIGIGDGEEGRDVRNDVYLGVQLDAGLRTAESRPVKELHAQVYCRGVEGIESPVELELSPDTLVLGNTHHIESELLEHMIVTVHADTGKGTATDRLTAHPKVVRLGGMRRRDVRQFTHSTATCQLSEYESQQVRPRLGLPVLCYVGVLLHDPLELALRKKRHYLTEYVFACVHRDLYFNAGLGMAPKIRIFKSPTKFSRRKSRIHRHYRTILNNFKRQ